MEVPETFFEDMDPSVSYQKRMWRVSLQRGEFPIAYPQTIAEFKQAKARYWGLITLVDEMVGRVLQRLRALGLEDSTIVVFTSDHGEMMGDHRLMSKTVTYEESIKVPLLISVPGMRRSVRVTSPAAQVDIVPTLLELLGQARPSHLEGESWASSMRGEKQWGGPGCHHREQLPRLRSRRRSSVGGPARLLPENGGHSRAMEALAQRCRRGGTLRPQYGSARAAESVLRRQT